MTDSAESSGGVSGGAQPVPASAGAPRPAAPAVQGLAASATAADHPELLLGAAFAGGFLAAVILRRLGG